MFRFNSLRLLLSEIVVFVCLLSGQARAAQRYYIFAIDTTGSIRDVLAPLRVAAGEYVDTIPVDGSSGVWVLPFDSGLNAEERGFQRTINQPKDITDTKIFLNSLRVREFQGSHIFRSLDELFDLIERAAPPGTEADIVIHLFSDGRDNGPARYSFERNVSRFNTLRTRFQGQMELCWHSLDVDLSTKMLDLIRKTPGLSAIKGFQIPPKARFSIPVERLVDGSPVTFINQTIGKADLWQWDFGDGAASKERNPTHTFPKQGQYTVRLTARNSSIADSAAISTVSGTVNVGGGPPRARFEIAEATRPKLVGTRVQFRDRSTGQIRAWSWDFGDKKGTGAAQHPEYIYSTPGTYTVTLKLTGEYGQDENSQFSQTVTVLPAATLEFSVYPSNPICGTPVKFNNESQGEFKDWQWDFGGLASSSERSPEYTFARAGTCVVRLTAVDAGGQKRSISREIVVGNPPPPPPPVPPKAVFTVPVERIGIGQSLTLVDQSSGAITIWKWDLGDGTILSGRPITHAYTRSGTFTITLTVEGPGGKDQAQDQVEVAAISLDFSIDPAEPKRNKAARIVNTSAGSFTAWHWDFGDGTTSDEREPYTHGFARPGTYTIRLSARGPDGKDHQKEMTVTVADEQPEAVFTIPVKELPQGQSLELKDESTGTIDRRSWKVEVEGAVEREVNGGASGAKLEFPKAGTCTISLTVSNDSGMTHTCQRELIVVPQFVEPTLVFSLVGGKRQIRGRAPWPIEIDNQSTGSIRRYRWDFGDGTGSDDKSPKHAYETKGVYAIKLTVIDQNGGVHTSTESQILRVTVRRPRPWPIWMDPPMAGGLYLLLVVVARVRPMQRRWFVYEAGENRRETHKGRGDRKFLWRAGEYVRRDTNDFTDGFAVRFRRDWLLRKRYYLERLKGRVSAMGPNEKTLANNRLVRNARITVADKNAVVFLHFDDNRTAALLNHLAIAVPVLAALIASLMWL